MLRAKSQNGFRTSLLMRDRARFAKRRSAIELPIVNIRKRYTRGRESVADHVCDVPRLIEHLDLAATVASALPRVTERRIARTFRRSKPDKRHRLQKLPSRLVSASAD